MKKDGPQDANLEAPDDIKDRRYVNNDDFGTNLLETDLTAEYLAESSEAAAVSTENISEVNNGSKKRKNGEKKKVNVLYATQDADRTTMDTGSKENHNADQTQIDTESTENLGEKTIENLGEKNVNGKRKRRGKKKMTKDTDETQCMDQVDGMSHLHISDGNNGEGNDGKHTKKEITSHESRTAERKESSLPGLLHDNKNSLDLCKDDVAEVSVGKESSISALMHIKENHLDLHKENVLLPDVVEVSINQLSSGVTERSEPVLASMEVDGKFIPGESQLSTHPNQMDAKNVKPENGLYEVNDESVVNKGHSLAESSRISSTCSGEVIRNLSSSCLEAEWSLKDIGQYPKITPFLSVKRKLIVLDVNGLLANIVMPVPKDCRGDVHILGRAIFKRPFCDDFLKFCFQNFDVGVWSSRSKRIIDRVVDYLLGDLKAKLLFCWDMSHSTQTGFNTLENIHKPLVCKELRKIWENDDPDLPWKNGDYNESNTLLLDDSPYKALLNPLHTAIFPNSYHYKDKDDNSLGPVGDLRAYLEGLLTSENVRIYVEQHPFGQSAINETNLSWGFYSGVLQTMSDRLQDEALSSPPA